MKVSEISVCVLRLLRCGAQLLQCMLVVRSAGRACCHVFSDEPDDLLPDLLRLRKFLGGSETLGLIENARLRQEGGAVVGLLLQRIAGILDFEGTIRL